MKLMDLIICNGIQIQKFKNNKYKKTSLKGLIFICYISDVYDGEFQYIKASHTKSGNIKEYDFTDEEADMIFGLNNIKSFKASRGSIIRYNISGVHRAKAQFPQEIIDLALFSN